MSESLLPKRFLFHFAVPCGHRDPLWTDRGPELDSKCRLADLAELESRPPTGGVSHSRLWGKKNEVDTAFWNGAMQTSMIEPAWLWGRVPKGFWIQRGHRVAYMQWLGRLLGFNALEDWYALKQRHFHDNHGSGLLGGLYGDSPLNALCDFMPDQPWYPWLLGSTPQRFWADRANRRAYMVWLGQELGIEHPDQWYAVTQRDFAENAGAGLLGNYYGGSVYAALQEYLPRRRWQPWRFVSVPKGFWHDRDNRIRYLNWLAKRLRIRCPEQWYSVTIARIAEHHGASLTARFHYSMLDIVRDYLPDYDWKPWLFRRIPTNYWEHPGHRRQYLTWLGEELGFRSPRDWHALSVKDVVRTGGGGLLRCSCQDRLEKLVRERYPDHPWELIPFSRRRLRGRGGKEGDGYLAKATTNS